MTDLAKIKKGYPFNQDEHYWEVIALAEQLQAENAQLKAHNRHLAEAIGQFKKYASHRPDKEISFFRFLAKNARDQKRECADTAVWDTVADALEALQRIRRMQEARGDDY